MIWIWLVVIGVCVHTTYLGFMVGMARGKYDVQAPAISGNEMFERHYRAHLNSIEQHVVFFPMLATCAFTGTPTIAALFGAVYLIGRIIYATSYVNDPKNRGKGMMTGCELVDGKAVEGAIERLFTKPDAEYLHIHFAAPGCYAARVERV